MICWPWGSPRSRGCGLTETFFLLCLLRRLQAVSSRFKRVLIHAHTKGAPEEHKPATQPVCERQVTGIFVSVKQYSILLPLELQQNPADSGSPKLEPWLPCFV